MQHKYAYKYKILQIHDIFRSSWVNCDLILDTVSVWILSAVASVSLVLSYLIMNMQSRVPGRIRQGTDTPSH